MTGRKQITTTTMIRITSAHWAHRSRPPQMVGMPSGNAGLAALSVGSSSSPSVFNALTNKPMIPMMTPASAIRRLRCTLLSLRLTLLPGDTVRSNGKMLQHG